MTDPGLLDPSLQTLLDSLVEAGTAPLESLAVQEARELNETFIVLGGEVEEVSAVEDLQIEGVPCRLYRPLGSSPEQASELLPVLVWFHGGGWVIGSLDSTDLTARSLANRSQHLVVVVDYRLAPESRFPAAVEDCWSVTSWLAHGGAESVGGDAAQLSVGGDSAGGNLAAVISILSRDAALALRRQILVYPVTDVANESGSYVENGTGYLLTADTMRWFIKNYTSPDQRSDWRASPLLADSLSGVASAYVLTAGFDPLRDEGDAYADRLSKAGVAVIHDRFPTAIHAFLNLGGVTALTSQAIEAIADALEIET
ncbi:unannotated protein [freshwater metagenome]|uniref:Unannotated protein n=1 Tax=freshwater metagenome TaxID=449393 RepID=A0A6J7HC74_9ZZZZ|nr:alpha/beta hydrolase fold domain-containing protein [Actinomycetota bacterium]